MVRKTKEAKMKIQAVKIYQTNKANQQSKTQHQPSFGKVIFDERGLERASEDFQLHIKRIFSGIKSLLGDDIINSTEHDVLVHPFQTNRNGGITILKQYFSGNKHESFFNYGELDFSTEHIASFIKETYREAEQK